MHPDKPTLTETKLLRMIEEGRDLCLTPGGAEAAQLRLCRQSLGGSGLFVDLSVDGEPACVWVADAAWCDWLSPRLCVQSFAHIPQDLLPVVGQWALGPLQACLDTLHLGPVHFVAARAGNCGPRITPTLIIADGERTLPLRLVEWPIHAMEALCCDMTEVTASTGVAASRGRVSAGWVQLRREELRGLRHGDILMLDEEARIEHNEAWVMFDELAAKVRCVDQIADDMREATAWEIISIGPRPNLQPVHLEPDGPVTAVADIGDAVIFSHAGTLCCGERIRMQLKPTPVSLRAPGDTDLFGQLIRLDDTLALRIA